YAPVDFTAPTERTRRILADCQIRAAIVGDGSLAVVPDGLETVIVVVNVPGEMPRATSFEAALRYGGRPVPEAARPDDLAYILYTSGSTGMPKGVMITHGNVLQFVQWCSSVFAPTPRDRFSSFAPFHFDPSVLDIYVAIRHGASLHLISEDLAKNPRELGR